MGAQARCPFREAEQAASGMLRCSSCGSWGTRCCDQTEGHALSLGVASVASIFFVSAAQPPIPVLAPAIHLVCLSFFAPPSSPLLSRAQLLFPLGRELAQPGLVTDREDWCLEGSPGLEVGPWALLRC